MRALPCLLKPDEIVFLVVIGKIAEIGGLFGISLFLKVVVSRNEDIASANREMFMFLLSWF